jgi:hypothetical protein
MKIAILLSGLPRMFRSAYPHLKTLLLDKYDCDLYCHLWDMSEWNQEINKVSGFVRYQDEGTINEYINLYKFKDIWVDKYGKGIDDYFNKVLENVGGETRSDNYIKRYLSMLCGIKRSHEVMQVYKDCNYDLVVRTRSDLSFTRPLDKVIEYRANCVDRYGSGRPPYAGDCFAIGSPQFMAHYCNLFEFVVGYYNLLQHVNTETMLPFHLQRGESYSVIDLGIEILRPKEW